MMKIALTGATGFVGRGLAAMCEERGIAVTGISRSGKGNVPGVEEWQTPERMDFRGHDAVINLAGEPIDRRWTDALKKRFRESRVDFTDQVVAAIAACPEGERPKALVNASAVGVYADRGDETLDESAPPGQGYLADLCLDWEKAAARAAEHGVRVASMRIGLVLGPEGRAWRKLRLLFRAGLGGRLGTGRQWMPWIHVADLREAILHVSSHESITGPVNAAAPGSVRNTEFTRELAATLHRPALFPAPAFALRLVLGEFASVLLASQRVVPEALIESGFRFRHPSLGDALIDLNKTTVGNRSDQR